MGEKKQDQCSMYWRRVCQWTVLGILMWLVVTFGVSWWSPVLDRWRIGQLPAGYWWATQGAIGAYLIIIVGYGRLMDHLEAAEPMADVNLPDLLDQPSDRRVAALRHG